MQSNALIVTSTLDIYPSIISTVVSFNLLVGKLRSENINNRCSFGQLVKSLLQVCLTSQQTIHYTISPLICPVSYSYFTAMI